MKRYPKNGCWEVSQKFNHLVIHQKPEKMKLYVSEKKRYTVCELEKVVLVTSKRNRPMESFELLRHFCVFCVSLNIALTLEIVYTRSILFDMSLEEKILAII